MSITSIFKKFKTLPHQKIKEKNEFLLFELAKLNEQMRQKGLSIYEEDTQQTLDSFEYQWDHLANGTELPTDETFMKNIKKRICEITKLPMEWFKDKNVIDIGCGIGRFSYGFLSLGSNVTSCDASISGIKKTAALCKEYKGKLNAFQANILKDPLPKGQFDLAFSFGVVHHTGNTYNAIKKVCEAAKNGGKVFLMVYGYPETYEDFVDLNTYERLREELRPLNFEDKIKLLRSRFPKDQVHGWFDATSPKINDLLKHGELVEILNSFGVKNVKRTIKNRNLHLIGDKL
jgi:SAM-dependent methyltransferase